MDIEYPRFGTIVVDGASYDHDVVIADSAVLARDKGPSRSKAAGHTPLTAAELIPLSKPRLIIGSGYSGRLPVLPEVEATARARGVEVTVLPTAEACVLLRSLDHRAVNAILHVTC